MRPAAAGGYIILTIIFKLAYRNGAVLVPDAGSSDESRGGIEGGEMAAQEGVVYE